VLTAGLLLVVSLQAQATLGSEIYDPRTDRDLTFYPSGAVNNDGGFERVPGSASVAIDRSIRDVTSPADGSR